MRKDVKVNNFLGDMSLRKRKAEQLVVIEIPFVTRQAAEECFHSIYHLKEVEDDAISSGKKRV